MDLDLQDLKQVDANEDNPLAPQPLEDEVVVREVKPITVSDKDTVVSVAQPVAMPVAPKGTSVKMLSGTVRTDY